MISWLRKKFSKGAMQVETILKRRLFSISEYHRMRKAGILHEDDRVELIEGEIVTMSPIGLRHMACVKRLNSLFSTLRKNEPFLISVQDPLYLDEWNEPIPDIVLLKYRDDFYENKRPCAEDALVVIDVSDSSISYDQSIKVPLYAKGLIYELWIVDLTSSTVQTFCSSNGELFQEVHVYNAEDIILPLVFPKQPISVSSILGNNPHQE